MFRRHCRHADSFRLRLATLRQSLAAAGYALRRQLQTAIFIVWLSAGVQLQAAPPHCLNGKPSPPPTEISCCEVIICF